MNGGIKVTHFIVTDLLLSYENVSYTTKDGIPNDIKEKILTHCPINWLEGL